MNKVTQFDVSTYTNIVLNPFVAVHQITHVLSGLQLNLHTTGFNVH